MATQTLTQMTKYRLEHPDYYAQEKKKNAERNSKAYRENTDRRDKMLSYIQTKRLDPEFRKKEAEYKKAYALRKKMALNNLQMPVEPVVIESSDVGE
jgi:hypothetical protein